MSQDVILDQYARLYEIPKNLALNDNTVNCVCLSYLKATEGCIQNDVDSNLKWSSINLFPTFGFKYFKNLIRSIKQNPPDIILASSDVIHIIIGSWLSKWLGVPFCADLYDNYEAFGLSKIPFLKTFYRNALKNADHVFCISEQLSNYISQRINQNCVTTIVSTIDLKKFFKLDQSAARNQLGLVSNGDAKMIGLCGSITKSRGVKYFFDGFIKAKSQVPSLELILAGNVDDESYLKIEGVTFLGRLNHSEMNAFYNAMDINTICMIPNLLGTYAFPQKTYEMIAANQPCIAHNFGDMKEFFSTSPNSLYEPYNSQSIADAILSQYWNPQLTIQPIPDWEQQVNIIDSVLRKIVSPTDTERTNLV